MTNSKLLKIFPMNQTFYKEHIFVNEQLTVRFLCAHGLKIPYFD